MNKPFKIWPSMTCALSPELSYIVKHHEKWVEQQCGRKPSGRPVLVWPDGRCRIEFGATFPTIEAAESVVSHAMGDR